MTSVAFRPPAEIAERLEWAKSQLGLLHLNAVIHLLEEAGFPTEDAREVAMYGLAASYLVASDKEGGAG